MKQTISIFFFLLFFLLQANVFGQNGLILGVRGGASLVKNQYTGDLFNPNSTISRLLRYQGGVDIGFQWKNLALTAGGRYVMKGNIESQNRDDPNGDNWITPDGIIDYGEQRITSKFDFFSVPVLFRYRLGKGLVKIGLSLGPQFNIGIGNPAMSIDEDFFNTGLRKFEIPFSYGKTGEDLLRKTNVSFLVIPEAAFTVSPYGVFKVHLLLEQSGDFLNESFLWQDGGSRKINGSFKTNDLALEIGYEHRLNLNLGVKY